METGRPVTVLIRERDADGRCGGGEKSSGSGYVLRVAPGGAADGSALGYEREKSPG